MEGEEHRRSRFALALIAGGGMLASACGGSSSGPGSCASGAPTYDPAIDPAGFTTTIDNRYLAYRPGAVFVYRQTSGDVVEQDVLTDTKTILGVRTVVVHDFMKSTAGELVEDTTDYFAEDAGGNVWYFGEDTKAYSGSTVSTEGSWLAGERCAKPGIVMTASSLVGDSYRQEYLPGEAEDQAKVVSVGATVTVPFGTFDGCLETEETTALAPGDVENKYYCPGLGLMLSVDVGTIDAGKREELVSIDGRTAP
jgi:hypothetical protein